MIREHKLHWCAAIALTMAMLGCNDDNANVGGSGGNAGTGGTGGGGGTGGAPDFATVGDAVSNTPELSTLASAMEAAGLMPVLRNGANDVTLFAPTNEAFERVVAALSTTAADHDQDGDGDFDNDDLLALPNLADILGYHLVSGQDLSASEVASTSPASLTTVEGSDLQTGVGVIGNLTTVVLDGASAVVSGDISAANGMVHLVDAVLFPAKTFPGHVVQRMQSSPAFDELMAAVNAAGLADDLASAAEVTVFAPTNAAFVSLPNADEILADPELLSNTLLYHAVPSTVLLDELSPVGYTTLINTLGAPGTFEPHLEVTLTSQSAIIATPSRSSSANVIGWDNSASNGVVHVVDAVVVPETGMTATSVPVGK